MNFGNPGYDEAAAEAEPGRSENKSSIPEASSTIKSIQPAMMSPAMLENFRPAGRRKLPRAGKDVGLFFFWGGDGERGGCSGRVVTQDRSLSLRTVQSPGSDRRTKLEEQGEREKIRSAVRNMGDVVYKYLAQTWRVFVSCLEALSHTHLPRHNANFMRLLKVLASDAQRVIAAPRLGQWSHGTL